MRCTYVDESGTDHDALVLREQGTKRDLVVIENSQAKTVNNVPHRSERIQDAEVPEVRNDAGVVVQPAMRLPKRQPGAYWRS